VPRIYKECVDCDAEFFVTEKSQEFLESKGWSIPKRCFECREKKKARNNVEPMAHADDYDDTVVDFFAPVDNSVQKDGRVRRRKRKGYEQ
jgi:hypothetical protein